MRNLFVRTVSNYFTGYVKVKVEGFYIERFINMCTSKKILLMNIEREKSTIMYANVGLADYKRLRQVAKKTKSKIKIQGKKGLPFTAHKYRKRKIFAILFCIVIAIIIISSNYIWNIEIIGNNNISTEEILQNLEESGLSIGLSKNDMDKLKLAMLLYDIGNVLIPTDVLSKKTPLTKEEKEVITKHPIIGAQEILKPISHVSSIIPIIVHHHENWDGSGYPDKRKGDDIPLISQIILIVDSYYAMISDRPYRKAYSKEEAIAEIESLAGKKYSEELVREFKNAIKEIEA